MDHSHKLRKVYILYFCSNRQSVPLLLVCTFSILMFNRLLADLQYKFLKGNLDFILGSQIEKLCHQKNHIQDHQSKFLVLYQEELVQERQKVHESYCHIKFWGHQMNKLDLSNLEQICQFYTQSFHQLQDSQFWSRLRVQKIKQDCTRSQLQYVQ